MNALFKPYFYYVFAGIERDLSKLQNDLNRFSKMEKEDLLTEPYYSDKEDAIKTITNTMNLVKSQKIELEDFINFYEDLLKRKETYFNHEIRIKRYLFKFESLEKYLKIDSTIKSKVELLNIKKNNKNFYFLKSSNLDKFPSDFTLDYIKNISTEEAAKLLYKTIKIGSIVDKTKPLYEDENGKLTPLYFVEIYEEIEKD